MSRRRTAVIVAIALVLVGVNILVYRAYWGDSGGGGGQPIGIPAAKPGDHDRPPATTPGPTECGPPPRAFGTAKPAARDTRVRDDFNGDGYPDLHLNAWYRPKEGGGWLHNRALILGSAKGPGRSVSLSTRVRGLEPKGLSRQLTGDSASGRVGDLDRDGYADLLIQAQQNDGKDHGWLDQRIIWGGKQATAPRWVRLPAGLPQIQAYGDFDGDGSTDLAGLQEGETVGELAAEHPLKAVCLTIGYGPFDRTGESAHTQSFDVSQRGWVTPGMPGLRVGDFDGDGRDDLLTRGDLPRGAEDQEDPFDPKLVPPGLQDTRYYRGTPDGLALATAPQGVSRSLTGAPERQLKEERPDPDRELLCTGRFDRDRYADVLQRDGTVLYGSPAGPGARSDQQLPAIDSDRTTVWAMQQSCPRVAGTDLNGDGADDLISRADGLVVRLSRPDGYGPALTIDRTALGLHGSPKFPSDHDKLGWDVAAADLDKDGCAELFVGYRGFHKPREEHGYYLLPGTPDGPDLKRARFLPVRELGIRP